MQIAHGGHEGNALALLAAAPQGGLQRCYGSVRSHIYITPETR